MSAAVSEHEIAMAVSPSYRLHHAEVLIDGGDMVDFARYPYLTEIIDEHARRMTIIKGAQMGFTIACILRCLEEARTENLRGILYLFPTDGEVQDFSKARFSPLIAQNEHIWGADMGNTDSAGLKEIGSSFVYFRGAGQKGGSKSKSMSKAKSMPIDRIYGDERDEMSDARWDALEKRLDGSLCPEQTILSTPTLPGYGVDLEYQSSDQRSVLWKCPACNGHTCLEDTYPECIAEPTNGDPFYLCAKCRGALKRARMEWVPRKPDVKDHRGYWASQLCSPTKSAADIIRAASVAASRGRMREFYNQTLARPYAEVEDQITEQQLTELLTDEVRPLRHEGPAAMGVDPGKPHWYEVRVRVSEKDTVQIARGRADSFDELRQIAKKFNVESGVMDQGADTSSVIDFVRSMPGWFGCLYVNAKKTEADWNGDDRLVKVGRTWLLDEAHRAIIAKRVRFHAKDEFWADHFVPQMTNLKRIILEDDETGQREARWVVTGGRKNDHLRHANAYAHLACERVGLVKSIERIERLSRQQTVKTKGPRSFMSA